LAAASRLRRDGEIHRGSTPLAGIKFKKKGRTMQEEINKETIKEIIKERVIIFDHENISFINPLRKINLVKAHLYKPFLSEDNLEYNTYGSYNHDYKYIPFYPKKGEIYPVQILFWPEGPGARLCLMKILVSRTESITGWQCKDFLKIYA
jgi:hypothetical protein